MKKLTINDFQKLIREERASCFDTPYDHVYKQFVALSYDNKDYTFFKDHASEIVETLRERCWEQYVPMESKFTSEVLCNLFDDSLLQNMTPKDAIIWFINNYSEEIYALTLSNTQSRRTRAGTEFEAIIELILTGAKIPYDSQGNIGKSEFVKKGLGKLVDVVSPGVVEYMINKRNTVLISAKTTLRERWQEVPEEMGRTGAREMFLATLDKSISNDVLSNLYEANIQVVTTEQNKEKYYQGNTRILTFEQLIEICHDTFQKWDCYQFSDEEITLKNRNLQKQMNKHETHQVVKEYFKSLIENLETE